MSDRELLELAAKAAGIELHEGEDEAKTLCSPDGYAWNPITDDGDALRLAVMLNMDVCFGYNYVTVRGAVQAPLVNKAGDPYAATRRAIVRAAAGIGR